MFRRRTGAAHECESQVEAYAAPDAGYKPGMAFVMWREWVETLPQAPWLQVCTIEDWRLRNLARVPIKRDAV